MTETKGTVSLYVDECQGSVVFWFAMSKIKGTEIDNVDICTLSTVLKRLSNDWQSTIKVY